MMPRRAIQFILIVAVAAFSGCGTSAPTHFYSLDATATPVGSPALHTSIMVGPVTVPASVDRPEMVLKVGQNQVEVNEFNRWDAPLDDSIARVVAGDLSLQLGTPDVTTAPLANFRPDYRVIINVQRFVSVPGQSALIEAVWTVRGANGDVRSGRTVARATVQGNGYSALAAAHSRALSIMSGDIATAIRQEARDRQQSPETDGDARPR